MTTTNKKVFSGTSGLVVPIPRQSYPPEFQGKSRLTYYASLFDSIEINSSFYKMPMIATVKKWAKSVPDDFSFTFKLSKTITHSKGLLFNPEDVDLFMQTISHVGNKKGCVLVQFPPGVKLEKFNEVEELVNCIGEYNTEHNWKVAIEFRHASWYLAEVYELLNHNNMAMVIHDLPASLTPLSNSTPAFAYLRFHGPGGHYRGSYDDDFLQKYAQYIKACVDEGKMVYFYFNNTMGDAVKNLTTLNEFTRQ